MAWVTLTKPNITLCTAMSIKKVQKFWIPEYQYLGVLLMLSLQEEY